MAQVRTAFFLTGAVSLFSAVPGDAQAYLDSGTTTVVVQTVIAAMASAMVFTRRFWTQIKAKLARRKPLPSEGGDASALGSDSSEK